MIFDTAIVLTAAGMIVFTLCSRVTTRPCRHAGTLTHLSHSVGNGPFETMSIYFRGHGQSDVWDFVQSDVLWTIGLSIKMIEMAWHPANSQFL